MLYIRIQRRKPLSQEYVMPVKDLDLAEWSFQVGNESEGWFDLKWVCEKGLPPCREERSKAIDEIIADLKSREAAPEPARGEPGPVENTVDSVYHRFRMWLRRGDPDSYLDSYVTVVWFGGIGMILLICLLSLLWSKLGCTGLCAAWEMMK